VGSFLVTWRSREEPTSVVIYTGGRTRPRGGDRQANAALWRIAIVRMRSDPDTRAYIDKRIKEGKSKTEAIRCLKRYIARELYAKLPREALA